MEPWDGMDSGTHTHLQRDRWTSRGMSHGTVGWDGQFTAFLDIYDPFPTTIWSYKTSMTHFLLPFGVISRGRVLVSLIPWFGKVHISDIFSLLKFLIF